MPSTARLIPKVRTRPCVSTANSISADCMTAWLDEPSRAGAQSVPAAARGKSGGLVSLGPRGVREGARREQADFSLDRVLDLSLVPRDGARVVRKRRHRARAQRALRADQS